ncbi:hypothetical protein HanPI659440_Chr14g0569111 [Helianthus annuus]|nr:hypothetical protein HanPI659440_Chr14g0569111 [Helianthus annuus]
MYYQNIEHIMYYKTRNMYYFNDLINHTLACLSKYRTYLYEKKCSPYFIYV